MHRHTAQLARYTYIYTLHCNGAGSRLQCNSTSPKLHTFLTSAHVSVSKVQEHSFLSLLTQPGEKQHFNWLSDSISHTVHVPAYLNITDITDMCRACLNSTWGWFESSEHLQAVLGSGYESFRMFESSKSTCEKRSYHRSVDT